jgi:hypothetical protein
MTRLEAIRRIRNGERLIKQFWPDWDGVERELEVWINHQDHCDFRRSRQDEHSRIGPLHLRFWSVSWPHWIHITPKQLLGFIRRNYPRK